MIETKIATVWYIEDNKLVNKKKHVSTLKYKDFEINFLKMYDNNVVSYIFKDDRNIYWDLCIIHINIDKFKQVVSNNVKGIEETYCDNIYKQMKNFDIGEYFKNKIKQKNYFNKCELKYISQHCNELYNDALESRNVILEQNKKRYETEQKERLESCKNEVLKTNQRFREDYKKMIKEIILGKDVKNINFEFYKDDKYENGRTIQNCFLYLAKKYKINIPISTQGFINSRLVEYNFKEQKYSFLLNRNKRGSTKIYEYFSQIYEKVKEDAENAI